MIKRSKTVEMENTPIILNTTIPTKNKLKRNHCLKLEKICDKNKINSKFLKFNNKLINLIILIN